LRVYVTSSRLARSAAARCWAGYRFFLKFLTPSMDSFILRLVLILAA
jgi:hypothetical protein